MFNINGQRNSRTSIWIVAGALSLVLAFISASVTLAQESKKNNSVKTAEQEVKIPQSAKDHLDLVEHYKKKATEYREEIDMHKKILSDYKKGVATNPKEVNENPYIRKIRLHCEKYIKAAENLALEADELAKYHTFRARELGGK